MSTDLSASSERGPNWHSPTVVVWVIIVGYCNADEIITCIRALEEQSFTRWGVLICENGGSAAFKNLIRALGDDAPQKLDNDSLWFRTMSVATIGSHPVYLLESRKNLGYAGAINACIAHVQSNTDWSYIWILNPDTQAESGALAHLLNKANSEYGIIGSRLIYKETNLVQAYGGVWQRYTARGVSLGRDDPADATVDVDQIESRMNYVLGACMLVSRAFINTIGVMNDDYFLYCEEVDWCLRRKSFKLGYAHDSIVYHTQGTTIGSKGAPSERSALAVFLDERNRLLIAQRFYRDWFALIAVISLMRLARYVRAAAWQNFFVGCRGWLAGVRGETGPVGI